MRLFVLATAVLALAATTIVHGTTNPADLSLTIKRTPARMVWQAVSDYPDYLRRSGLLIEGSVTVRVSLDLTGKIEGMTVLSAVHPALIPTVLDLLRRSKFSPEELNGKPVESDFVFTQTYRASSAMFASKVRLVPQKPPGLPPQYDYDVAPVVTSFCTPAYPEAQLLAKAKGTAIVGFLINAEGRVTDTEVLSASRPEFGLALASAVQTWEFVPARKDGHPSATMAVQQETFDPSWSQFSDRANAVLSKLRKGQAIADAAAADQPLHPLYRVAPAFPAALQASRQAGSATVEFIVAEDGEALFPRVVSATRPEFGAAACTAVSQWFYDAPRVHGKPADVRARMEFDFNL